MIILFNDSPNPPNRSIGTYRIATVLRNYGLEVEVIDFLSHWDFNTLIRYLDSVTNIEWIGFSTKFMEPNRHMQGFGVSTPIFSTEEKGVFTNLSSENEQKLITHIKNKNKQIIIGGPNADIIKHFIKNIDIICIGYGDNAVIAIHEHITANKLLKFEYFNNIKIIDADKDYPVNDLNNLETSYDYSDFIRQNEVLSIEIGRGCIFHCAFCDFAHLGKKPNTYIRPKESIKHDIVERYKKYNTTKFLFVDDTFNDSIEKMQMIKEIREETNIPFEFWAYCRLDLLEAKPEQFNLVDKIGWTAMTCGVETFNRDSGKKVGKGADPEKLKKFLLKLRETFPKLKIQINILVGLPHDTEQTVTDTVDWFIENNHITPYVRPIRLSIKNPEGRKFSSKIALNPEKYGYNIVSKTDTRYLVWETKYLNLEKATNLSNQLQNKLKQFFWYNKENRNTIHYMVDDTVITVNENNQPINLLEYVIKEYIEKKLKYRNIT